MEALALRGATETGPNRAGEEHGGIQAAIFSLPGKFAGPQTTPISWRPRAGGGAVHSIKSRHSAIHSITWWEQITHG